MGRKRFIAGAICPACGVADRLVVEDDQRRCVACGYHELRPLGSGDVQAGEDSAASRPLRWTPIDPGDVG